MTALLELHLTFTWRERRLLKEAVNLHPKSKGVRDEHDIIRCCTVAHAIESLDGYIKHDSIGATTSGRAAMLRERIVLGYAEYRRAFEGGKS